MSRSSDIASQMQKRRADRKKPKINAKLKRVSIDESQRGGIAAAQENKPPPMTVQKRGGRNSFSFTVSAVLHVVIALLLGFLAIKNQVTSPTDELAAALLPQELPQKKRVLDVKRKKPNFDVKEQVIKAPIQRTPIRNANIPKRPGASALPNAPETDLAPIGPGLNNAPTLNIGEGLSRPIQPIQNTISPTFERPTTQGGPIADLTKTEDTSGSDPLIAPDIDTSGSGIIKPKIKIPRDPEYPKNAKRAEKEGTVILQATVGVDGIAKNIIALTDLGYGFEQAAIDALKKFRFVPAEKKGEKIEYAIRIPFEFKLEEE